MARSPTSRMKGVLILVLACVGYTHGCMEGNNNPLSRATLLNNEIDAIGKKNVMHYTPKSHCVSKKVSPFQPSFASLLEIFRNKGKVDAAGKKKFKDVIVALNAIDGVVDNGPRMMTAYSSWPQWMDYYHKLSADIKAAYTYITDMKHYHSDNQYHDAGLRFRGQYESRIPSIRQFYHGIVNKQPFLGQKTLFTAAAQEFDYDLNKVQGFIAVTMEFLVMGSIVETTDLAFKGMLDGVDYNDDVTSIAERWDDWMKQVDKEVEIAVDLVKSRFRDKLRSDIQRIAAGNRGLSNRDFLSVLYRDISDQYFYKDFFTVVYNPISGGYKHYVGCYGGDIQFRLHGRNMMVASVEKGWRPKCVLSYQNYLKMHKLTCSIKSSEQWFGKLWNWDTETAAVAVIEYGKHNVWYSSHNTEYHQTCNQNVMLWPRCVA